MPRGGKTTIRVDEQLGHDARRTFALCMGPGGGALGGMVMGSVAAATHEPLLGIGAWVGIAATAYGTARLLFRRLVSNRQEKLHDVTTQLATQIAESTSRP
jgi:hypothetical protein